MKKLSLLMILLISGIFNLKAQSNQEVVYLKNGSVIHGIILEQVPDKTIKIKTSDGSIFVYQMSDVDKISMEEVKQTLSSSSSSSSSEGYYQGWAFEINPGFMFGIGKNNGSNLVTGDVGLYKRMNNNLAIGLNAGVEIPTTSGSKIAIPASLNFRFLFPVRSTNLIPFFNVGAGYTYNTAGDVTTGSGRNKVTVSSPDWIELQVMPGLIVPIGHGTSLRTGFGYIHGFYTEGGKGFDALAIKLGFDFYKSGARKVHIPAPIIENGLQLTLEGGYYDPFTSGGESPYSGPAFTIASTYKFDKNISLGLGVGYDSNICGDFGYDDESSAHIFSLGMKAYRLFGRANYRVTDRTFSLLGSVDAGVKYYKCSSDEELHMPNYEQYPEKNNGLAFFVAPSAGFSVRVQSNTYLELKAGYAFSSKRVNSHIENIMTNEEFEPSVKHSVSSKFVSLGLTHTFSWFGGKIKNVRH